MLDLKVVMLPPHYRRVTTRPGTFVTSQRKLKTLESDDLVFLKPWWSNNYQNVTFVHIVSLLCVQTHSFHHEYTGFLFVRCWTWLYCTVCSSLIYFSLCLVCFVSVLFINYYYSSVLSTTEEKENPNIFHVVPFRCRIVIVIIYSSHIYCDSKSPSEWNSMLSVIFDSL